MKHRINRFISRQPSIPPIYTRPAKYKNMEVPKILLSGNQKEIDKWREEESLKRTKTKKA